MTIDLNLIEKQIFEVETIHDLLYVLKPKFLGKDSEIIKLLSTLKDLSIEERKVQGKKLNLIKNHIENAIEEKKALLQLKIENNMSEVDITTPVYLENGSIHPISFVINEVKEIFSKMGFEFKDGPEIEDDYHNFTALNVPLFHPARQMQDTFYIKDSLNNLLRTHTTSVDIRNGKLLKSPFKIMSCGKTYRNESDKTHSPMFHQFEGLYVDKNLSMSDLKSYLEIFLKTFFEINNIKLNFRPSYFPFTTPSAEVDIYYHLDSTSQIIFGEGDKTLEILGCGILHSNVMKELNIDSEKYSAIAFGGGIERLAMLKYGFNDVRYFYNGNLDWIEHFDFK